MTLKLDLNRDDATRIITHPDIYPFVSDDGSVPRETYVLHEQIFPLVVYDPEPVACSIFYPVNTCTLEIHTQTLPDARKRSFEYGRAMLAWIWWKTDAEKIVAAIPSDNRKTLLYTLRLGFKIEGISTKSFIRNGTLLDRTYIGIRRN